MISPTQNNENTIKNVLLFFMLVLIFYLMSTLSSIIIPLVLAFLAASVFQPLIIWLRKKRVPKWIILPVVAVITLLIMFSIFMVLRDTALEISSQQKELMAQLNGKIDSLLLWINELSMRFTGKRIQIGGISSMFSKEAIQNVASNFATSLGSFTGSFFMFLLYYLLFLGGLPEYRRFLKYVQGDSGSSLLDFFEVLQKSIYSYMIIHTFISILTGLITTGFCLIFGVKFAVFWGFVAFLLNYIPTVGSTIAVFPPTLMAIIQFDSFNPVLLLFIFLISTQITMGNVVEPYIMGHRLRLNMLTIIFGLVFWGYIWGIPGMILTVPLLVIFKTILEQLPGFEHFGRLMGYEVKKKKKESPA